MADCRRCGKPIALRACVLCSETQAMVDGVALIEEGRAHDGARALRDVISARVTNSPGWPVPRRRETQ